MSSQRVTVEVSASLYEGTRVFLEGELKFTDGSCILVTKVHKVDGPIDCSQLQEYIEDLCSMMRVIQEAIESVERQGYIVSAADIKGGRA